MDRLRVEESNVFQEMELPCSYPNIVAPVARKMVARTGTNRETQGTPRIAGGCPEG